MTHDGSTAEQPRVPSSWFTIVAVVIGEFVVAAALAFAVAQIYVGHECSDPEHREEHSEQCAGGFPYPLF